MSDWKGRSIKSPLPPQFFSSPQFSRSPTICLSLHSARLRRRPFHCLRSPMAKSRSLILFLTFLLVAGVRLGTLADEEAVETELKHDPPEVDFAHKMEVERLHSRISDLESSIAEKVQELKSKEDAIVHMNQIIKEKSESILMLQRELEKKGAVDATELVEKARARAAGLEKQIEKLKSDIQLQSQRKDALEVQASVAEKGSEELILKVEMLQKTNEEQKQRIKRTSHALKVAEESLLTAQEKAASMKKELAVIYEAWLPPWLATHLEYCQEYTEIKWRRHVKPAFGSFLKKASQVTTQVQMHVGPHLKTVQTKWVPLLEEKWTVFSLFAKPHMESASTKVLDIYETSLTALKPRVRRIREVAHPYILHAKKVSKPHVDHVATIARPHVEKVRITLKPYTKKIVRHYAKFLKSATASHLQVQAFVQEQLRKHDLTRALATKELVWFLASACLAFPVYFIYEVFIHIFCKKPRKTTRNTRGTNNARQRNKRRHADK